MQRKSGYSNSAKVTQSLPSWIFINISIIVLACGSITGSHAESTEWFLVRDGQPNAKILIADEANRLVTTAAEEFQYHVERASGAKLPIVKESEYQGEPRHLVAIGPSKLTAKLGADPGKLPREGYLIHATQGHLLIVGKDKPLITYRGDGKTVAKVFDDPYREFVHPATLFGVYDYLEKELGVRWLWPGSSGEVIPQRRSIAIRNGRKRVGGPELMLRNIHFRAASGRLDKWYKAVGLDREQRARQHRVWERRQRMGMGGGYFKITHTFTRWWKEYHKEHPDWFAMQVDGTRNWPECWSPSGVRLCLSNDEVVEQLVKNSKAFLESRKKGSNLDYPVLSAGQNDGNVGYCLCEKCRALDPPEAPKHQFTYMEKNKEGIWTEKPVELPQLTDRYVNFWNRVARRFEAELPGVMVGVFAYNATYRPPVREKYHPNLCMAMATHDCLMRPRGRVFAGFRNRIRQFYDRGLRNWYWRPNLFYFDAYGMPLIYAEEAVNMIRFGVEHGSLGCNIDVWNHHWGTDGFNMYAVCRVIANPRLTYEQILEEYAGAFGSAKEHVKQYLRGLEKLRDNIAHLNKPPNNRTIAYLTPDIYRVEDLEELQRIMERAQEAVKGADEEVKARVEFLAAGLRFACMQRRAIAATRRFLEDEGGVDEMICAVEAREEFLAEHKQQMVVDVAVYRCFDSKYRLGRCSGTKFWRLSREYRILKALPLRWRFCRDPSNQGEKRKLHTAEYDDSSLPWLSTSSVWEKQGFPHYNGYAWYRTRLEVPEGLTGQKLFLWFGAVDESTWVYVNGKLAGENIFDVKKNPRAWLDPFLIEITDLVHPGEDNLVAVKVLDASGFGGIYQRVLLVTR